MECYFHDQVTKDCDFRFASSWLLLALMKQAACHAGEAAAHILKIRNQELPLANSQQGAETLSPTASEELNPASNH